MRRDMLAFVASPGASRPVALQAPSREAPGENIPSLINAPVFKQRFPEEATSILTQGGSKTCTQQMLTAENVQG